MPAFNTPSMVAQTTDSMFSGFLDPVLSEDYFKIMQKSSVVQQLARQIPLGPTGVRIPHWNGDVRAKWVGEGQQKPVTKGSLTKQDVVPHKIATIFAASSEVVRVNPQNYLNTMRERVAEAIALAFDAAVLHGVDSPFGKSVADTSKSVKLAGAVAGDTAFKALNDGLDLLLKDKTGVNPQKKWNGTLFDNTAEVVLNTAVDAQKRPLFIEPTYTEINSAFRVGRVLGRPAYLSDHVTDPQKPSSDTGVLGFMGDWTQIIWGQIGGISYDVSDQATLDLSENGDGSGLVSLWQNNLVAVRVEAEFGVLVNDAESFVKLTA
jgi:HK97 family phage major capsid protein